MLPTRDAAWVAAELTRRFTVTHWSFTLTATDANRWAIRLARQLTRRPKIAVFSYCYHGSVDEAFIVATTQGPQPRVGNVGAPVDPRETTRVVEFNDPGALERELSHGDVAAMLMEPALSGRRHRTRRVPAPVHDQPRHPDDALSQHGADVSGHHQRRRGRPYRGVRRRRGRAARLTSISPVNRLNPLRVLGSIRGRCGEAGTWELLDEALKPQPASPDRALRRCGTGAR
jgi:hypothetical protein